MSFTIDRQSLEELNLTGKFRYGSVYALFNQVKTRGGEQLLDEFFNNPLTDENIINQRTAIFRFFQENGFAFPFDPQQIMLMREYVDAASVRGQAGTFVNTAVLKFLSSVARDERYKILIQGLHASITSLKKTYVLATELSLQEGPCRQRALEVKQILESASLNGLINTDIYKEIPVKTIAAYDFLIRNKLNSQLKSVLDFIFEVDLYIAVAAVAQKRGFIYAKALPDKHNCLEAVNLKHPCVEGAVGNDILMHENSNVIFLTGANMAGKSTWMKSVGIALYLAHVGFPVAADTMEFSVWEGIYSSINVADNISLGYSHFYAEVIRVKGAAEATSTGRHLLLMFDELFKGTNVKDAFDGTLVITEAFAKYKNCLFIVSTHIIEVGKFLDKVPNIQFKYMPTIMNGPMPAYTYKLEDGITEDRQGMMIIRNEGILEMIG